MNTLFWSAGLTKKKGDLMELPRDLNKYDVAFPRHFIGEEIITCILRLSCKYCLRVCVHALILRPLRLLTLGERCCTRDKYQIININKDYPAGAFLLWAQYSY